MPQIEVSAMGHRTYKVAVTGDGSTTTHDVTLAADDVERLGAPDEETLVRASFQFLVEREAKESILRRFELSVIARYFPEYEDAMRERFTRKG